MAGKGLNPHLSRRDLLRYTSILTALGLIEVKSPYGLFRLERARAQEAGNFTVAVTRPDDMVSLKFEFINAELQGPPARLVRRSSSPAYVVVHFEPQSVGEEWFEESADLTALLLYPPTPPVRARLADPSRLSFFLPGDLNDVPFELGSLLDFGRFTSSVVPVSQEAPENEVLLRPIREPLPHETAIEAPYLLTMSPEAGFPWKHETSPVEHNGRIELWHTRLSLPPTVRGGHPQARAVWTPDFDRSVPLSGKDAIPLPLSPNDRWQLIRQTSDFQISGHPPKPVSAERFMLSALGAWVDIRGDWTALDTQDLDIIHWTHLATMGRDQFVRVVKAGYLFPFGHRAAAIEITERKFEPIKSGTQKGKMGAFLRKRLFVVVKESVKTYTRLDTPFPSVEIKTRVTPNLNLPENDSKSEIFPDERAFWARVGNDDFRFHLIGTDHDGHEIEFLIPLIFVSVITDGNGLDLTKVMVEHLKSANQSRRTSPTNGQKIAYAPGSTPGVGDAAQDTNSLEFRGFIVDSTPSFVPKLRSADVRLQAVEQVKGSGLKSAKIDYHPAYIEGGFDAPGNTAAEIWAKFKDPIELNYGESNAADRSGGVVVPNMSIRGLSRKLGPVGSELAKPEIPSFDAGEFFKGAKILGGIELADVIGQVVGFDEAPKLVTKTLPDRIETSLVWHLEGDQLSDQLLLKWEQGKRLDINALFVTPLDGSDPTFTIKGDLRRFALHMIGDGAFLIVHFNRLTFESVKGQKPDVDVDIAEVEFAGILSFVNELREFLDTAGAGLSIDVTPTQIQAGYTLDIPSISVGVFSLRNISLGASVTIPFDGRSISTTFAFARRDDRFVVSYTIFGGGGYLEITVGEDPDTEEFGIRLLEANVEFGGTAALDIGVASGEIHLMAGITFLMGTLDDGCKVASLEGYVRLGGELDVLGIVSVSAEFKMSLSYDFGTGEVWGQATLVIEVEVLMVSESVELTVEKRFAGGGGGESDPSCSKSSSLFALNQAPNQPPPPPPEPVAFGDLIMQTEWTGEYAAAFSGAEF